MRVLGISGTPRAGGNSEVLLRAALAPFEAAGWAVDLKLLSALRIAPCRGCDACAQTGACVIRDDMDEILAAYAACDALLIASPVYYRFVTAQLKAVFDRTYALGARRPLAGKPGGAIAVGRGQGAGQAIVLNGIHNFYLSSGALCVPGELNGLSAVADRPGAIAEQPRRLEQARTLGENVLAVASRLR